MSHYRQKRKPRSSTKGQRLGGGSSDRKDLKTKIREAAEKRMWQLAGGKLYVPIIPKDIMIPESGKKQCYATPLLGRDYHSVACARGAQKIRSIADFQEDRFDAFFAGCRRLAYRSLFHGSKYKTRCFPRVL